MTNGGARSRQPAPQVCAPGGRRPAAPGRSTRLDRAGDDEIENLGGWLTTGVSRICLDQLRTRSTKGEEPVESGMPDPGNDDLKPEDVAILTDSTARALAIVVDTLMPIERIAFALHDVFDDLVEETAAHTPSASAAILVPSIRFVIF